jgi:hypothetical protein
VDELLELILQLSITFSTEEFLDGQPSSNLLVYFSGILGFSADARSFLPAKRFTPHLSALIYVQRLLFLEYTLPYRAYPFIGIAKRARLRQHDRFEAMRIRYMTTGAPSGLEEFQSLRDCGRVIARTDMPSFLLRWSDDGQTVFYNDDFILTMPQYRTLAKHFISKAAELCAELMFDLRPDINLAAVKDDMANTQCGFSFVQHPENGIAEAYLELSARACTTHRNGLFRKGQWDWKAIYLYFKKTEALEEMLSGGLRTGCGQTPRVPGLLSLLAMVESRIGDIVPPLLPVAINFRWAIHHALQLCILGV